jgi:hypothetical protein
VRRRSFDDGEVACVRFLNINVHYKKAGNISKCVLFSEAERTLRQPKWHKVHTIREKSSASMDEFTGEENMSSALASPINVPEFRDCFHEMRLDKIRHPFRGFLAKLRLQLHFQDAISNTQIIT